MRSVKRVRSASDGRTRGGDHRRLERHRRRARATARRRAGWRCVLVARGEERLRELADGARRRARDLRRRRPRGGRGAGGARSRRATRRSSCSSTTRASPAAGGLPRRRPGADRGRDARSTTSAASGACARSCRRSRRPRRRTSSTSSRSPGAVADAAVRAVRGVEARPARVLARGRGRSSRPRGIRVHTVLPGFAETEGFPQRDVLPKAARSGRSIEPERIARSIARPPSSRPPRELVPLVLPPASRALQARRFHRSSAGMLARGELRPNAAPREGTPACTFRSPRAARRRRGARGRGSPSLRDPGDRDLVAADHEVDVDRAPVAARAVLVATGPRRSRRRARCGWPRSRRAACRRRRVPSWPMRPSRSTSATSPSRDAPSSNAARPRMTPPPCSASISTARPPSNRTSSPRMIVPSASTSGFVERTCPSVRCGIGRRVDLLGRAGSRGARSRPPSRRARSGSSSVAQQADRQVGARALRSGARRSRRSFSRPAAAVSASARSSQAATGSGSSSRQTWAISLPEPVERLVRRQVGIDEARPRLGRAGHDRPVDRAGR